MSRAAIRALFGPTGEVFSQIADSVFQELVGARYEFMESVDFQDLLLHQPGISQRVYWTEMLCRAHWAAASNVFRHKRWQDACALTYEAKPNYLGFCAALRGLVEAASDADYSLRNIAGHLARHYPTIQKALAGAIGVWAISPDLEEALIHFQFARKLGKEETAPGSHRARNAAEYIRNAQQKGETHIQELYSQLCNVTHPSAHSVLWMAYQDGSTVLLTGGDDKASILALCEMYRSAIVDLIMQCMNQSLMILKALNRFDVQDLRCQSVEPLDLSGIPAWRDIERIFATHNRLR